VTLRRRVARRFERAILATVMSLLALIIERRLVKAIGGTPRDPLQPAGKSGSSPGGKLVPSAEQVNPKSEREDGAQAGE
jgi:hypothetical protein